MTRRLATMTRDETRTATATDIVVIPIGSTEQHATHLPLLTDTLLAEAVLERACQHLAGDAATADIPLVITPAIPIGASQHHLVFAAMSLRPNTLLDVLRDVTDSLVTTGFRRLFIVNGHGGNDECIRLAVKELVLREQVAAAACSYSTVGGPATITRPDLVPGHAGWAETALMMATHPDLVRVDQRPATAVDPPPLFNQRIIPGLDVQVAGEWARVDGFTDPSHEATADDGHRLLDNRAEQLAGALRMFHEHTRRFARDPQDVSHSHAEGAPT